MLEALAGLNFFLAVNKVLGGSLALGRLFRLFTQLGMDLCAGTGSGTNRTRNKVETHIFDLLFLCLASYLFGYLFFLGLRL